MTAFQRDDRTPREWLLQLRSDSGLTSDYLNVFSWWRWHYQKEGGLPAIVGELERKPMPRYSDRYPRANYPEYYTAATEPKIQEIDGFADEVNGLVKTNAVTRERLEAILTRLYELVTCRTGPPVKLD